MGLAKMVSTNDLLAISTIMTSPVISVRPELPLYDLIRVLVDRNIGGVPVIDDTGTPIGMVSRSDLIFDDYDTAAAREGLVRWAKIAGRKVEDDPSLFDERNLATGTVADVMTTSALAVRPSTPIRDTAELMIKHRIHRVPVVDQHAKLVGIVTTFDLARWVARGP